MVCVAFWRDVSASSVATVVFGIHESVAIIQLVDVRVSFYRERDASDEQESMLAPVRVGIRMPGSCPRRVAVVRRSGTSSDPVPSLLQCHCGTCDRSVDVERERPDQVAVLVQTRDGPEHRFQFVAVRRHEHALLGGELPF